MLWLLMFLGRVLLSLRYRIRVDGLEPILERGTEGLLFLPNHPAFIDPLILSCTLRKHFRIRPLADQDHTGKPFIRGFTRAAGVIPIPDPLKYGKACEGEVQAALNTCMEALAQGDSVMLYPAGRIYRSRFEDLGGTSALEALLPKLTNTRVVLIRTTGLWGSDFSRAHGKSPDFGTVLWKGLGRLLANGLFFGPRREVKLVLREAPDLPREADRQTLNRWLEAFYNEEAPPALHVPHTLWDRGGLRELPEPTGSRVEGDPSEVSEKLREEVFAELAQLSGKQGFASEAQLSRDLGLDSLARMELITWIAQNHGHEVQDPEALHTVGDVLLAAAGHGTGHTPSLPPPPEGWFAEGPAPSLPSGTSIQEVFLRQAAKHPTRMVVADAAGGSRTYRDLVTALFALVPRLKACEGNYLGLMLPASVGAGTLYLAALFAGKTPVMVNWTVGPRNLAHGLDLLGVRTVLTAKALCLRLEAQGIDLSSVKDRLVFLEDVGRTISWRQKCWAAIQARTSWASLRRMSFPDTAVVLFTSGSESLPKAVPLSHENLLTNLRDVAGLLQAEPKDRLIGFLPPFHSFGLMGTTLLPLLGGLPTVYHPNPTDGAGLAKVLEAYRISMLVGTPTFLSGILRMAKDAQLVSLRLAVSGAEKCPEGLYDALARRCPGLTVIEGYGITECSPVVSVNRPGNPQRGTIGLPLPSVDHAIVDPVTGVCLEPGQTGLLLVRGPSIFKGYLRYDGPSPFVLVDGVSWYRTGDLVREGADGVLRFEGRLKRFVKLGGEMVSLPAIEETLNRHFLLPEDGEPVLAVEATPSEERPEVVLFTIRDLDREGANAVLREAGFSPLHFVREVHRLDHIPLLGTGKVDYRTLKSLLSR